MSKRLAAAAAVLAMLAVALLPQRAHADPCKSGYSNPTVTENCQTDSSTWSSQWKADRTSFVYEPRVLAGYASSPAVNRGDTINFYIRSPSSATIAFYRLGWYGGAGGRLVQSAQTLAASAQPACRWQNPGTVNAYFTCNNWKVSYSLPVPQNWTSGVYLASIRSAATAPAPEPAGMPYAYDIVFVVRDDGRKADFIYQQAVATDQAYNSYNFGPSLYNSQTVNGQSVPIAKASFERPYDALDNMQFYRFELPFIFWMESQGYDVVYSTDVDMHERTTALSTQYKALLVAGHSEYWSKQMYDLAQNARDSGVHLGFFSGNTLYWQMRLEPEAAPAGDSTHHTRDRVMVVFRHPYPPNSLGLGDPNPDPTLQTIYWRQFPLMRDEEALVGVHFTHPLFCNQHVAAWAGPGTPPGTSQPQAPPKLTSDPQPLVVADSNNWVYEGTGVHKGDVIPNVYGQESDSHEAVRAEAACGHPLYEPPARRPAYRTGTFSILSISPFNHRELTDHGMIDAFTVVPVNTVVYQACSGAWVFGAGDIMWGNTLAPSLLMGKNYTSAQTQQMTRNLLDVFAGRKILPAGNPTCMPSIAAPITTVTGTLLSEP